MDRPSSAPRAGAGPSGPRGLQATRPEPRRPCPPTHRPTGTPTQSGDNPSGRLATPQYSPLFMRTCQSGVATDPPRLGARPFPRHSTLVLRGRCYSPKTSGLRSRESATIEGGPVAVRRDGSWRGRAGGNDRRLARALFTGQATVQAAARLQARQCSSRAVVYAWRNATPSRAKIEVRDTTEPADHANTARNVPATGNRG